MSEIEFRSKETKEFFGLLPKMSGEILFTIMRMLDVNTLTDKIDKTTHKAIARDGTELALEMLDLFDGLDRASRRAILKAMRKEAKRGGN